MFFTRKARWVKDGHRIPDPDTSSYAGVVSRESILISLTTAAFWGLDFMESYIRNEYLQSSLIGETLYNIGLEHQGKLSMIVRELYGGIVPGHDFWHHLRSCMKYLGFESCLYDPDVWMCSYTNADEAKYY